MPTDFNRLIAGTGRHADIFQGIRIADMKPCIVKAAKEVGRDRIEQEIKIMRLLAGGTNIILLQDVVRDMFVCKTISVVDCIKMHGKSADLLTSIQRESPSLIFEYINNTDFRSLYPRLQSSDIRYYIRELLRALQFCHGKDIMHRDVRPHNIMIDHAQRKVHFYLLCPTQSDNAT